MTIASASVRLGSSIVVPSAFGLSSVLLAQARAVESRRPDRVVDDPHAQEFVVAAGWGGVDDRDEPEPSTSAGVVSTRFLDDVALSAGHRQVVVLGAATDTRACRLPWAEGTTVYEIDHPDLLVFKRDVLAGAAPRCERVAVPVPSDEPWAPALRRAGFAPGTPTTWLVDGAVVRPDHVAVLLRRLGGLSTPGSVVGATTTVTSPVSPHDGHRGWDVRLHDPSRVALALERPDLAGAGHRTPGPSGQTRLLHAVRD